MSRTVLGQAPSPLTGPLVIYADGSASNRRRGAGGHHTWTGWGYIGTDGRYGCGSYPQDRRKSGADVATVAELRAVWHALRGDTFTGAVPVLVRTDSLNAISFLSLWKNGGTNMPAGYTGSTTKTPTLHRLRALAARNARHLHLEHVHGHNGDLLNECADTLAQLGMRWLRDNLTETAVESRAYGIAAGFLSDRSLRKDHP